MGWVLIDIVIKVYVFFLGKGGFMMVRCRYGCRVVSVDFECLIIWLCILIRV